MTHKYFAISILPSSFLHLNFCYSLVKIHTLKVKRATEYINLTLQKVQQELKIESIFIFQYSFKEAIFDKGNIWNKIIQKVFFFLFFQLSLKKIIKKSNKVYYFLKYSSRNRNSNKRVSEFMLINSEHIILYSFKINILEILYLI